jgi:hypothetical protein
VCPYLALPGAQRRDNPEARTDANLPGRRTLGWRAFNSIIHFTRWLNQ